MAGDAICPIRPVNIGPAGRRRRLIPGVIALAAWVGGLAALQALHAAPAWRAALFPVLGYGLLGVGQAWTGTWVALAARGLRELEHGTEPITQADLAAALRRRGRRLTWGALLATAVLTAATLLAP